jgi:hypothetical protein
MPIVSATPVAAAAAAPVVPTPTPVPAFSQPEPAPTTPAALPTPAAPAYDQTPQLQTVPLGQPQPEFPFAAATTQEPTAQIPLTRLTSLLGSHKKAALITMAAVALLVIIVSVSSGGTPDPTALFTDAINDSLAAKSLEAKPSDTGDGTTGTVDYYLKDLQHPVVATNLTVGGGKNAIALSSYASPQNAFVKLSKFSTGTPSSDKAITPLLNKWVQLRKNGIDYKDSSTLEFGLNITPEKLVLGNWVFGNFSGKDRAALSEWAVANHLYTYDAAKVTKQQLNGVNVNVYDVSINTAKLATYNQKAATIIGFKAPAITDSLSKITATKELYATVYIATGSHRLQRFDVINTGNTSSITYSKFNKLKPVAEPQANLTSPQFNVELQKDIISGSTQ